MKSSAIINGLSLLGPAVAFPANTNTVPAASYQCKTFDISIPLNDVTTVVLPISAPQNQIQAVNILNSFTDRVQPPPSPPTLVNLTATYSISAEYCQPIAVSTQPITLQILTHGIGFNRSYWNFVPEKNSSDSQYNYIAVATAAGYHTLSYNRLGIKGSTIPDPIKDVQAPTELAILVALTTLARNGKLPCQPSPPAKTVHVGHSYGSILSVALAAAVPTLSDGLVLTGFSGLYNYQTGFLISTLFTIANLDGTNRFPNTTYSNGYLTWPCAAANQYSFFSYPNFDPTVLEQAEATKQPFALGELVTELAVQLVAPKFTAPVYVVEGERDLIFCGGNCTGLIVPGSDVYKAFNGSSSVESLIVSGYGHGMNLHLNASGKVYAPITNWLKSKGL